MSHILEASGLKTDCVWAEGAPFEMKDTLKQEKGYFWSDGASPEKPIKAWFNAGVVNLDAELQMLATELYPRAATLTVDSLTGYERFTARYQSREKHKIPF